MLSLPLLLPLPILIVVVVVGVAPRHGQEGQRSGIHGLGGGELVVVEVRATVFKRRGPSVTPSTSLMAGPD